MEATRRAALELARSTVGTAHDSQRQVIQITFVVLGIAILIGLLMAARIARRLVGAVQPLVTATRAVQQGAMEGELDVRSEDEIGELTRAFNYMLREPRLKDKIRATFGRYVDPRLVEGLVEHPELTGSAGDKRVLTIPFADMQGFTMLSEQVTPASLVALLNRYLGLMADEVRRHDGVVDKFIGDAVMAFFGPPFIAPHEQGRMACATALAQVSRFEEFRGEVPGILGLKQFMPEIGLRIGIATGEVVVGNIGSASAMSYTVIGDTVNTASRIENANKLYGTRILLNDDTAALVRDSLLLREIDRILPPGKAGPVTIHEVMGPLAETPEAARLPCATYGEGLDAYRAGDRAGARNAFERCLEIKPDHGPAREMSERAVRFSISPPPANWAGTHAMASN